MGAARNRRTLLLRTPHLARGSRSSVIQGGSRAKNDIRKLPICEAIRGALAQLAAIFDKFKPSNEVFFRRRFTAYIRRNAPPLSAIRFEGQRDKKRHKGAGAACAAVGIADSPYALIPVYMEKNERGIERGKVSKGTIALCEDFMYSAK